jgi:uncharacterized membrane protein YfcA
VALAVVVCLPMVPGILSGAVDAGTALTRFLAALVGSYVACSGIGSLWRSYSEHARRARITELLGSSGPPEAARPPGPLGGGQTAPRDGRGEAGAREAGPPGGPPGGLPGGGPSPPGR